MAYIILAAWPCYFQVICEKAPKSSLKDIDKKKYLVTHDFPVHEFLGVIRKRIKLPAEQALFLFVNNSIASSSDLMSTLYEREKDEDGFLYITYSGKAACGLRWNCPHMLAAGENTFGAH